MTHKGDGNGTNSTSDHAPASKKAMRTARDVVDGDGDSGEEAPVAKRLKRAAAAKAAESFGCCDEVGVGEDVESEDNHTDDSYENDSDENDSDEGDSGESDEPKSRQSGGKRKGRGGWFWASGGT